MKCHTLVIVALDIPAVRGRNNWDDNTKLIAHEAHRPQRLPEYQKLYNDFL